MRKVLKEAGNRSLAGSGGCLLKSPAIDSQAGRTFAFRKIHFHTRQLLAWRRVVL